MEPSFEQLIGKVGNRFVLVVAAAKRARQINEQRNMKKSGDEIGLQSDGTYGKAVSLALLEIARGEVNLKMKKVR